MPFSCTHLRSNALFRSSIAPCLSGRSGLVSFPWDLISSRRICVTRACTRLIAESCSSRLENVSFRITMKCIRRTARGTVVGMGQAGALERGASVGKSCMRGVTYTRSRIASCIRGVTQGMPWPSSELLSSSRPLLHTPWLQRDHLDVGGSNTH